MPARNGPVRTVIMGAAGRDFHNFNVAFRDDPSTEVVAFTATQIPGIANRRYPPSLAGDRYPGGIPILPETQLERICRKNKIGRVVFAYSDVSNDQVLHSASIALAAGADFTLLGPDRTMLSAKVPVISVTAVRTGVGKSQTARWLARRLRQRGLRTPIMRHPMPYGDLERQSVQRFSSMADLDAAHCTVEEREEYEPHIAAGGIVFAGVDYQRILRRAELEADLLIWDGGNNDFPFVRPDLSIVLTDPLRAPGQDEYFPGEAVLRMANIIVVAKCGTAGESEIVRVIEHAKKWNSTAAVVRCLSRITLDDEAAVRGKRVIVIEDGPTLTHGGMPHGAGYVAALQAGASEIVDPRDTAAGSLMKVFEDNPHIGMALPALGYSSTELADLQRTIEAAKADVVVLGTPSDLGKLIHLSKPVVRARYEFEEASEPGLWALVEAFLARTGLAARSKVS